MSTRKTAAPRPFFSFNLESSEACRGSNGVYVGKAYGIYGRGTLRAYQFKLGKRAPDTEDSGNLFDNMLGHVDPRVRPNISAITIARFCLRERHDGEPKFNNGNGRMERLVSVVQLAKDTTRYDIEQPTATDIEDRRLRTQIEGVTLQPVLFLDVTGTESESTPVVDAVAIGASNNPDQRLYLAFRPLIGQRFIS